MSRIHETCDVASLLSSCKDSLTTIDLLRRTIRMLVESLIEPLEASAESISEAVQQECAAVEQGMASCLADRTLEMYVNTSGVSCMLRETTATWCRRPTDVHNDGRPSATLLAPNIDAQRIGYAAVMSLRRRLADDLEMAHGALSLIGTQLGSPTAASAASHAAQDRLVGALVGAILRCSEAAFCGMMQAVAERGVMRSGGDLEGGAPLRLSSPTSDEGTKPFLSAGSSCGGVPEADYASATFAARESCATLMNDLKASLNELSVVASPFQREAASYLLVWLQSLKSVVKKIAVIAEHAVELHKCYRAMVAEKLQELRDMAKWYRMSAQAAKEWAKEQARREAATHALQQRAHAMQKEMDHLTDQEALLRTAFVSRWAVYLPRGGFPSVRDDAVKMAIVAMAPQAK